MIPKDYKHSVRLSSLQDDKYYYVQLNTDLTAFLDYVAFPRKWKKDITGMIVIITDGDIDAMWLSESNAPYLLSATYHPLPYYRPMSWTKKRLPIYWQENNEEYCTT